MATRSTIGIRNSDGSATLIYCHWDGYYEGVGKTLKQHYNNEQKIHNLISLGNVSSLDVEIYPNNSSHSFDQPNKGITVFYGRDRGEEDQGPVTVYSLEEHKKYFEEYNYLWEDQKWKCCKWSGSQFKEYEV